MKITNKNISDYFKLAKSKLCDGSTSYSRSTTSTYICSAITDVLSGWRYTCFQHDVNAICRNIIISRFPKRPDKAFPHSVETYLREVVKVPHSQLTYKNVQQFRHRWLDSLIEEFDIEGYYEG